MIFIYLLRILVLSSEIDPNTFSNYQEVQITHLHLEWMLDLENRYINSTVQYNFKVLKDNLETVNFINICNRLILIFNKSVLSMYIIRILVK